jgi:hypothetical protein
LAEHAREKDFAKARMIAMSGKIVTQTVSGGTEIVFQTSGMDKFSGKFFP